MTRLIHLAAALLLLTFPACRTVQTDSRQQLTTTTDRRTADSLRLAQRIADSLRLRETLLRALIDRMHTRETEERRGDTVIITRDTTHFIYIRDSSATSSDHSRQTSSDSSASHTEETDRNETEVREEETVRQPSLWERLEGRLIDAAILLPAAALFGWIIRKKS